MPPKKATATPKKTTTKKATAAKKKLPPINIDSSSDESSSGSEDEAPKTKRKITKKKPVARKPLPKSKPVVKVKKVKKKEKKTKKVSSMRARQRTSRDSDYDSYSSSSDYSDSDYSDSGSETDSENDDRYEKIQKELGYNPKDDEDYQGTGFTLPKKPAIFCFIGTQGSGKSYMIKFLMYKYCQMKYFTGGGITFSVTKFNGDFLFLPDRSVIDHFDEELLKRHVNNLRRITEEGKKKHGDSWKLKPNFIILNDCLGTIRETSWLNNFFACYRHTNTTVFIDSQYLAARSAVSTLLRSSTTFAFMWPSIQESSLMAMHAAYGGVYKNQEDFKFALLRCKQEKHSCLLYKALQPTLEDTYLQFKAGFVPSGFRMTFGPGGGQQQGEQQGEQQQQHSQVGLQNIQYIPQQQQQMQPQQQPQQWTPNFYQQPQMQQQQMQSQSQFNLYQPQQYNPLYRFP
jgi:hypothetical protein